MRDYYPLEFHPNTTQNPAHGPNLRLEIKKDSMAPLTKRYLRGKAEQSFGI
jgi:hypothetical protein